MKRQDTTVKTDKTRHDKRRQDTTRYDKARQVGTITSQDNHKSRQSQGKTIRRQSQDMTITTDKTITRQDNAKQD